MIVRCRPLFDAPWVVGPTLDCRTHFGLLDRPWFVGPTWFVIYLLAGVVCACTAYWNVSFCCMCRSDAGLCRSGGRGDAGDVQEDAEPRD